MNSQGEISQKKGPDIGTTWPGRSSWETEEAELPGDSLSLETASSFLWLSISEDFRYAISFYPDSAPDEKENSLHFTEEETEAQGAETIRSKVK